YHTEFSIFFLLILRRPHKSTLFPYTTLFRSKVYMDNAKGDLIEKTTGLKIPTLMVCGIYDKNGGFHTGILLQQSLPVCTLKLYEDRKSTRLNSSHVKISYAVFCLKKKKTSND